MTKKKSKEKKTSEFKKINTGSERLAQQTTTQTQRSALLQVSSTSISAPPAFLPSHMTRFFSTQNLTSGPQNVSYEIKKKKKKVNLMIHVQVERVILQITNPSELTAA